MTVQFNLGVNRLWPGEKLPPGDKRWGQYTHSFHPENHTVESFMDLVQNGFAFAPVMKNSHRVKTNFLEGQHLVLDFDNGDITSDLDTLRKDAFISTYAAFLYSTPSSTPDEPRSRAVFVLSDPLTDMATFDNLARALVRLFPDSDQTVGEASRFLYGSKPKSGTIIPLGRILPLPFALTLIPPPQEKHSSPPRSSVRGQATHPPLSHRSNTPCNLSVTQIIEQYAPRSIRQNSNPRSRWSLRCPLCTEYVEAEEHSFTVAEDNNLWRCFACELTGNAWTLLKMLAPQDVSLYLSEGETPWDEILRAVNQPLLNQQYYYKPSEGRPVPDSPLSGGSGLKDSPQSQLKSTKRRGFIKTETKTDPASGMRTWTSKEYVRSMAAEYFQELKFIASQAKRGTKMRQELFRENTEYYLSHFLGFPVENMNLFPDNDTLSPLLSYADGEWDKSWTALSGREPQRNPKVVNQETCLCSGNMTCEDDGPQYGQVNTCGGKGCPNCASKQARQIGKLKLPDGRWRTVWYKVSFPLGTLENGSMWFDSVARIVALVQRACGSKLQERLKRRKKNSQNRLWHRALGFHMDWPFATVHVKLTFWEPDEGGLDKDIETIRRDLGDAEIVWDQATENKEIAQFSMLGAATASLISLDPDRSESEEVRRNLYAAFWHGTKGAKICVPMDRLAELIAELKPEPPPTCEKCGKKLRWVRDHTPTVDSTSPTSPHYAYKTYQNTG